MKLFSFINKYLNKNIDYDGYYGSQCVDVFRQYCKDVLKIPHTGVVEGAKDLYLNYENLPLEKKYFQKISDIKFKYGDIAIWDKTSTNPYGHVAIVINQLSEDEILVVEQNGFNQDGLKLSIKFSINCIGGLRYKGKVTWVLKT